MSLRVGVLTFHRPINYGSYWQARSLVEGLRTLGYCAELIDHDSPATRIAERRLSLRPTLPTPVPREDIPRYKAKIRAFDRAHDALPRSCSVPLERIGGLDPYDVVVIGSDEVWNLRHPLFGGRVAFYGARLPTCRVVSYAASFGNFSCWEGLAPPWSELIDLFDAISVRDENSWWMLRHALGREVPLVLDPCLQFDLPRAGKSPIDGAYALVYGHNFSPSFVTRARTWASDRGIRLVSLGYRNDWADESWIEAGPLDFPGAVSGAEVVVTNFFHGCVFALATGRPFVTEVSDYRAIKVRGLLEAVGGEAHLIGEETLCEEFATRLESPISITIQDRIAVMRAEGDAYLCGALG